MHLFRMTSDATADHGRARMVLVLCLLAAFTCCLLWLTACTSGGTTDDSDTSSTEAGSSAGDVEGTVGTELHVAAAVILVGALQATFQPAMPVERIAEETPSAPADGESFYQARVRMSNTAQMPLRIDANDFSCAVGDVVVPIDPTRSGPLPRSILKNTSLDLLLTFKAPAGYQPMLLYRPAWYKGVITIAPAVEPATTTTT